MKIAVVTPYFNTHPEWLLQCHESVLGQTHPCTHILVADGKPMDLANTLEAQHLCLPVNFADYGDTPRGMGSVMASRQGFDAIAYLDADNWYYPEHIATMVRAHQESGAAVVSASRNLHRLDGSLLGLCNEVDGKSLIDTSCFFLTRAAFALLPVWWNMQAHLHAVGDRVMVANMRHLNLSHVHSPHPTVAYRTAFIEHYRRFSEEPPPGTKSGKELIEVMMRAQKEEQERVARNRESSTTESK